MKKLIGLATAIILLTTGIAMAQTLVSKEEANNYYQSCLKGVTPGQPISPEAQQMVCGCTAARLTQFFTVEDNERMKSPDPAIARPAFNKMLINVYAPCMEFPTRDYHYNQCINNPQTAALSRDPQKLCRCMANEVGNHMASSGSKVFEEILSREPNIEDPMSAVFNDPEFQNFAQSKLLSCLK